MSGQTKTGKNKSVAIIGTGISGLSAAWLLSQTHDVTLYESANYIGGHSHTVDITLDDKTFPVDTGFIVYNPQNYPNLTALFNHLKVETTPTDMSFAASLDRGGFEYAGGTGIAGLLAQPSNLFRKRFWGMLAGIVRFYHNTQRYIDDPATARMTLGELLSKENYRSDFIQDHLSPMGAAIWSGDQKNILEYPALAFLKFFKNHGLTQFRKRPEWRTVVGGSREYIKKLTTGFASHIHLSTPVSHVMRTPAGTVVCGKNHQQKVFDHVIFACHADQALALLTNPSREQVTILQNIPYQTNEVYLHTDTRQMPRRKSAWASWNYIESRKGTPLSYWMNKLQPLPTRTPVIVTLNPAEPIDPRKILGRYSYDHPLFTHQTHQAQKDIWTIQGQNNIWFAGAYLGDGFHEDGIQAGLSIAEKIGAVRRPWQLDGQNLRIGLKDHIAPEMPWFDNKDYLSGAA
ncbi:NAD(P)/FAD-dependent oxidoreductase [Paremcibacter congregatus]|uniref:NAD/FAD-binding protein n=1 Tax=Paremcibacter congregatus TaxID=2043170 RepID=A0A2G4YUK6_9PROT|nr:FAD-dependent oxidoreductase [Paremcibacter congregatus]PHZ86024.1 NAD/FAD-binding protein [Paremcibacter congregatus]QDE26990.1 NAD/FAD-binding protein [Paremcibacter congregatus]